MAGYVDRLLDRAAGRGSVVRPRPRFRFEPMPGEVDGWVIGPSDVPTSSSGLATGQGSTRTLENLQTLSAMPMASTSSTDPTPLGRRPVGPSSTTLPGTAEPEPPDPGLLSNDNEATVLPEPRPAQAPPVIRGTTLSTGKRPPPDPAGVGREFASPVPRRSHLATEAPRSEPSAGTMLTPRAGPDVPASAGDAVTPVLQREMATTTVLPGRSVRGSSPPMASRAGANGPGAPRPDSRPVSNVGGRSSASTRAESPVALDVNAAAETPATTHRTSDAATDIESPGRAIETLRSTAPDQQRRRSAHLRADDDPSSARAALEQRAAARQSRALPTQAVRGSEPDPLAPVVNVTIGRVELRPPSAPPPPVQPPAEPGPRPMSLTEYLDRRNGRP